MSTETHKLVIAIEYLDTAATLWVHELNYFSATHLAAAADEIAGKACRIKRMKSHFDDLRDKVRHTLTEVGIDHTEQQLRDAFYGAKNAIKHMDSDNDASVNIDPRKVSADYIIAAYRNFEKLGLASELSNVIRQVVDANALHIDVDAD